MKTPKTAVITGSSSGIGHGIAAGLAAAGYNIVLNGIEPAEQIEPARKALEEAHGIKAIYSPANMMKPDGVRGLIAAAGLVLSGANPAGPLSANASTPLPQNWRLVNLCWLVPLQNLKHLGLRHIRNRHANLEIFVVDTDLFHWNTGRAQIIFNIFDGSNVVVGCYDCFDHCRSPIVSQEPCRQRSHSRLDMEMLVTL